MGAPGRLARRLSAALAAFLLLTLAAVLAPPSAQAQAQCPSFSRPSISVTVPGPGQLAVIWSTLNTGQSDVDRWDLDYRTTGASVWTSVTISDAAARNYTITGLAAGTAYQLRLRARPAGAFTCPPGPFTAIATATTSGTAGTPVLTAKAGDGRVTLFYYHPGGSIGSNDAWSYKIIGTSTDLPFLSSLGKISGSHTITGLQNGRAYTFEVNYVGSGRIQTSNQVTVTPNPPPPPVLISDPDRSVTAGTGGTVMVCYNLLSVSHDGTTYLEKRPGRTAVPAHSALKDTTNGVSITAAPAVISALVVGTGNVNFDPCATVGPGRHTVTWEWNGPDGAAPKGTTSTTFTVVNAASPVLTATAGDGQVTLTWTWSGSASGLAGWRFSRSGRSGSPLISGSDASTRSYTVTGLDNGTAYTFGVWGVDSDGVIVAGTSSNLVTATPMVPGTAPAAPTGFTATAGDGRVTLNWSDPGDATITRWEYQQKTTGNFGASWTAISGSGASTTSHAVTSLTNGTAYTFRIRAVSAAGNGAVSAEQSATPGTTKTITLTSDQPNNRITEGDSGHQDVTITITLGEPAPEDFNVLFTSAGDPGTATEPTKTQDPCEAPLNPADTDWCLTQSSAAIAIAEGETEATATVRILGDTRAESDETIILHVSSEEPGWTQEDTLTLTIVDNDSIPAAPTGFTATAGDGQVVLAWSNPNDATITGYELRYDKTADRGSAAWTAIDGSSAGTVTHTVSSLENGAEYSFRLRAVNSAGNGTATAWATATPTAAPVTCPTAQPPTALSVTPGSDRLSLTWAAPTQAERSGWQLQYRETGGSWTSVTISSAGATGHTIRGLAAGTAYQVRLQATVGEPGANCPASAFATAAGTTTATTSGAGPPPTGSGSPSTAIRPPGAPRANAGSEIEAAPGSRVRLDGSGSTDPDGGELRYAWRQVLGWSGVYRTAVALEGADTARPSFLALAGPHTLDLLVFRLTVTDPEGQTDTDTVWVRVRVGDAAPGFGDASAPALDLAPGVAMTAVTLPEATGGNGALTYTLTSVPAGRADLAFDPETRRLSGTPPTQSGRWTFTYRADDADSNRSETDAAIRTFEVTVRDEAPVFGDATVPALALAEDAAMTAVVLPEATGGNGALTYTLTSAPAGRAGLAFDRETRRLSGTPPESGRWTFTWRADDADANRTEADAAIRTFEVRVEDAHTALVQQTVRRTLAAVAHRALTGALDNIGARLAAEAPMSGLTLAGETVPLSRSGAPGDRWRSGPDPGTATGGGRASRGVESDELLNASAFSLGLGAAGAGHDPLAPRWAVWGRGDVGTFAGRPDGMHYDGEMRTGWLGVDARAGAWVAGLAVSHGAGEADYGLDGGETGRLETELTAVYPYGRWTVSEGLELRGVLGAGGGEARHRLDDGAEETSDLAMRMASLGLRHDLPTVAGMDLAARAEASVVRMETDEGPDPVHGLTADSWRLRAGVEASRR